MRSRSSRIIAAAFFLLAAQLPLSPVIAQASAQNQRGVANAALQAPKLVVQITVDQMQSEYLDRYRAQFTGGLARLLRNGARFTNAMHDHAVTETAPGHATLWSGRFPSHTGVVLNEIGVADAGSPLLFGRIAGASPLRFRGTAFFDWVKARDQRSKALSVSRKDRGAILPIGRSQQQIYWYSYDGRFTTSRYYRDTLPEWVTAFNARNFLAPFLGAEWKLLLPPESYSEVDSVPVENRGEDFLFPHIFPSDEEAAGPAFTEYPWIDSITVNLALAGVSAMELGRGPSMDVLAVSLSSTDAVGHRYGPDSREIHDQVLRVDRQLGRLIDSLFLLRDSSSIVFVLGADHGVAPYPELKFPGSDPNRGRVDIGEAVDSARKALVARGLSRNALVLQSGIVFVDREALKKARVNVDSLIEAVRAATLLLPGISRVDRVRDLEAMAKKGDNIARRWFQSIPSDLPAVLTITMEPYFYDSGVHFATHGTPYDYDAHIPVIMMGPMFLPGTYDAPIRSVDVAPTLAAAVGIKPTERVDGKVLQYVIKPSAPARK